MKRRHWLRTIAGGAAGLCTSGWGQVLASQLTQRNSPRRCILLWMDGGPSQTDTFDLKDGERHGTFRPVDTSVPGIQICEHLPRLAQQMEHLAVIRSLKTREGDHSRGTHLMRTGHAPMGIERHPAIGAALSKELRDPQVELPAYVSIAPNRGLAQDAWTAGYLGPRYSPLVVGENNQQTVDAGMVGNGSLQVQGLSPAAGVSADQLDRRLRLWQRLQDRFLLTHQSAVPVAHQTVYQSAVNLMHSQAAAAFDLQQESEQTRTRYGNSRFGQGCLMARRLIEQGVAFVEVTLSGWDTHQNSPEQTRTLCGQLDAGWASLLEDLSDRGLLQQTTILWMGEFGRTPQLNRQSGRDHFPSAWSAVLGGAGIAGGQVYGRTSDDGRQVEDNEVGVSELLATLCAATGVAPTTENISNSGRPLKIADGTPVPALLSEGQTS